MAIRNFERELEKEILAKLADDSEVKRKTKEFAEEVRDTARTIAFDDMDKGYVTGEYAASIHVARRKNRKGQFTKGPAWMVVTDDEKAHFLEYGTGFDAPGTHSPWGRFTATPAYATFAKTALRYRGTPDGELGGGGANWISGADKMGMASILHRHGDRAAAAARPIRQYTSRQQESEDRTQQGKSLKRKYTEFLKSDETAGLRSKNTNQGRRD